MNARPDPGALHLSGPRPVRPARHEVPVHDARSLTGADGLAQIVLDEQVYSLRITRAGRLILTK